MWKRKGKKTIVVPGLRRPSNSEIPFMQHNCHNKQNIKVRKAENPSLSIDAHRGQYAWLLKWHTSIHTCWMLLFFNMTKEEKFHKSSSRSNVSCIHLLLKIKWIHGACISGEPLLAVCLHIQLVNAGIEGGREAFIFLSFAMGLCIHFIDIATGG